MRLYSTRSIQHSLNGYTVFLELEVFRYHQQDYTLASEKLVFESSHLVGHAIVWMPQRGWFHRKSTLLLVIDWDLKVYVSLALCSFDPTKALTPPQTKVRSGSSKLPKTVEQH
jgi:hypothetical protein